MSQTTFSKGAPKANGLPRGILFGSAALILFSLIAASAARVSGIGTVRMPHLSAVETLSLRFEDQNDGGVAVRDASDNQIFYTIAPETNGFMRATLRGLVRERKRDDFGPQIPFTLTRWSDGTISLEDPTTGRRVSLDSFGPTNAQAFANLFAARGQMR